MIRLFYLRSLRGANLPGQADESSARVRASRPSKVAYNAALRNTEEQSGLPRCFADSLNSRAEFIFCRYFNQQRDFAEREHPIPAHQQLQQITADRRPWMVWSHSTTDKRKIQKRTDQA